ncbi:MAG: MYG1 family protein [Oscillospiraceae bacterium]
MIIPDTAFTHGGHFHADDVFSAALLQICNPKIHITRGYKVPEGFDGIVFDIGGGEYDHHGSNTPVRANGVKYAAFGLLWRAVGADFLPEKEAQRFDEHFIQPIDLDDNTGCGNILSSVIGAFNPAWDETLNPDACFARAVGLAKEMLLQKIKATKGILRAKELVDAALAVSQDGIVILEKYAPWKMTLIHDKDAKFAIYPSQRGGFCAQCVPTSFSNNAPRIMFPEEWAGLENEALAEISEIKGLSFCHAGRFLITAATKDEVISACKKAMEQK